MNDFMCISGYISSSKSILNAFFNVCKFIEMKNCILILTVVSILSCQSYNKDSDIENEWIPIWNGNDLTNWHSYLGTPYNLKTDSLGKAIERFGIDNDPLEVIKVVEADQGNAIRISGVAWGMIYTEDSFQNYHLKLKVKWGEDMHIPREKGPRDSGLLYHGFGEPGSAYPWMGSQELQIQQGDMGDYWPVGDVEIDIPSVPYDEKYYIYKADAELRTYYLADILDTATADRLAKRRVYKSFDAEKPHGEWNDIELITIGDSSIHIVNGNVVMRLFNSRKMNTNESLKSGKIILQSEGAEVYYKDIYVKNIYDIPEAFK
jgi:hypothetical protein